MNLIHQSKVRKKLDTLDFKALSHSSNFKIRQSGKISAFNFLLSFFILIQSKCYSLRQWALIISCISGTSISFQAISKRLNRRALSFVKLVFKQALFQSVITKGCIHDIGCTSLFNRILLEDSTCIKLPQALKSAYPGSNNQYGSAAVARIQLRLEIFSGDYLKCDLSYYRNHDANYAVDILSELQPGDLVLRDLGYSIYDVFDQIGKANAFYISRFKVKAKLYSVESGQAVDLAYILKQVDKKGIVKFESNYLIGAKSKLKCRVVCIKLTPQQIEKRKKQIRKNGNRNNKPNKQAKYLHLWNIFITNLDKKEVSIDQVYKLYSLRWHIELVFKTWKSYFDINTIFQSVQGPNPIKPELLLYLCLTYFVLIVNPIFKSYQRSVYKEYKRLLSPMKFMKALLNDFIGVLESSKLNITKQLAANCCYDIRKDRTNIYEILIYL